MNDQDQLWNMYAELSEFKNSADEKSVEEVRLRSHTCQRQYLMKIHLRWINC